MYLNRIRPRGGVVTQRSAKPCTPVQFRAWPPSFCTPADPTGRLRIPFTTAIPRPAPPRAPASLPRCEFGHAADHCCYAITNGDSSGIPAYIEFQVINKHEEIIPHDHHCPVPTGS